MEKRQMTVISWKRSCFQFLNCSWTPTYYFIVCIDCRQAQVCKCVLNIHFLSNVFVSNVEIPEFLLKIPLLAVLTHIIARQCALQTELVFYYEVLLLPVKEHLRYALVVIEHGWSDICIDSEDAEFVLSWVKPAH
jgi:hypothetical protein